MFNSIHILFANYHIQIYQKYTTIVSGVYESNANVDQNKEFIQCPLWPDFSFYFHLINFWLCLSLIFFSIYCELKYCSLYVISLSDLHKKLNTLFCFFKQEI